MYLFEREHVSICCGGPVKEEGDRILSRLCAEHGPQRRTQSHDPEITT